MFRLDHNKGGIVWKEDVIVTAVVVHVHKLGNRRQRDEGRSENMVLGIGSLKS